MQTFLWMLRHPRRAWHGIVTMRHIALRHEQEWRRVCEEWELFKAKKAE